MRALGWQDLAVGVLALAALGWLVARRLRRKGAACEDCPGCRLPAHAAGSRPGRTPVRGVTIIPLSELIQRER